MGKQRLEAFSDGVIAIIITVMVLELKIPAGVEWISLRPLVPVLLCYLFSFVVLGIYWSNHHHLFQACRRVNGRVLWANLHLLFWLSLTPFVTAWMGENHFAPIPVAAYGLVLLCSGIAYYILTLVLVGLHGSDSVIATAVGSDRKGKLSVLVYVVAVPLALRQPLWACALYVVVAVVWLIPDRRIENLLTGPASE